MQLQIKCLKSNCHQYVRPQNEDTIVRGMAAKRANFILPVMAAVVILLIVIYIVRNKEGSPVSNSVAWVADKLEGFGVTPTIGLKCPVGYKFFNDATGGSFCCGGTVNPYSHTCEAPAPGRLCAFSRGVADPRGSGLPTLPLCGAMADQINDDVQKGFCPMKFPNYAQKGKCCAGSPVADGEDCSAYDLADKTRYCVIGTPKSGEQSCQDMKLAETGTCPSNLEKMVYTLGERESRAYGPAASGLKLPLCFGMEGSCIPDAAVSEVQKRGVFKDKNVATWKYSCGGYDKYFVRKDLTGAPMDARYV